MQVGIKYLFIIINDLTASTPKQSAEPKSNDINKLRLVELFIVE